MCLNDATKIAMRLDENTIKFIVGWVVPLVRELARSQDSPVHVATLAETPRHLDGFFFSVSQTPNIRDKVTWNPVMHSWQLFTKKPKVVSDENFVVDHELSPEAYEAQKFTQYHAAIAAWNNIDGSTRFRIHDSLPCKGPESMMGSSA